MKIKQFFFYTIFAGWFILSTPFNHALAQENSVLWKIEYPKTQKVSYILGTIHLLDADKVLNRFPLLEQLIQKSEIFFCEADRNESSGNNYFSDIDKNLPQKFKEWFGKDSHLVDSFFTAFDSTINYKQSIDTSRKKSQQFIFLAQMFVSLNDTLKFFDPSKGGYDDKLKDIAKTYKKEVSPLDDRLFMNKVIKSEAERIFPELIITLVKAFVAYENNDSTAFKNSKLYVMNKYLESGIYKYETGETKPDYATFTVRNRRWVKILEDKLKTKSAFIAVGIDHLSPAYHDGLIPALKRKGFIVTPVNLKPVN